MNQNIGAGPPSSASGGGLGWMPIAVVFIVMSAALGGILVFNIITEPNLGMVEVTVTLNIDYGNGSVDSSTITAVNHTALGILEAKVGIENLDMTHYEGLGWLVNGMNGVENGVSVPGIDDTSAYYWQYYVNDELGPVAAERFSLCDGDVLEWRFEEIAW
jgi:hypothetical protein